MKNIRKYTWLVSLILLAHVGCKKDENKVYVTGGTAPVITTNASTLVLLRPDSADLALKISWTNPNYTYTTGVNSQLVKYLLEIDSAGKNFASETKYEKIFDGDLNITFTTKALNDILFGSMKLADGIEHHLEIRITSYVTAQTEPKLVSGVAPLTVTPYLDVREPKVKPPTDGTLWMLGDGTYNGWTNPLPAPYDVSQKFTQVSPTLYEITVDMPGGAGYKFIQSQGVWSTQYSPAGPDPGPWQGGSFVKEDADPPFSGPPNAGQYKITVDFQEGIYTVIKL